MGWVQARVVMDEIWALGNCADMAEFMGSLLAMCRRSQ